MFDNLKKFIIDNYKSIICFVCIILFLALAENVFNNEIMKGDIIGYQFISNYLIKDNVTPIMKVITWCGSAICLILVSFLSFFIFKNKKTSIFVWINLISITILNQTLKFILHRPRPTDFRIIEESGYSFPSGHSMASMAFYGFLIYLIYKKINNKYLKWGLICFLSILILFIGISRIYLGVHYTSDVLAGFLISIAYLILFVSIVNKFDL